MFFQNCLTFLNISHINIIKRKNNPKWLSLLLIFYTFWDIFLNMNSTTKVKISEELSETSSQKSIQRPNIDNLIKRIISERKRERKNSIIMIGTALAALAVVSYWFTKV